MAFGFKSRLAHHKQETRNPLRLRVFLYIPMLSGFLCVVISDAFSHCLTHSGCNFQHKMLTKNANGFASQCTCNTHKAFPYLTRKKPPEGGFPVADDITYRLNVNSVSRVYSAFLPASTVYVLPRKLSIASEKFNIQEPPYPGGSVACSRSTFTHRAMIFLTPFTLRPSRSAMRSWLQSSRIFRFRIPRYRSERIHSSIKCSQSLRLRLGSPRSICPPYLLSSTAILPLLDTLRPSAAAISRTLT